ncbi:MbtH family protein [Streptomyces cellulosae]|uniref:MbtH family protein n=1 Tax=Streptomyces cellulosae TaxID=1968 RepID=A0ABW7XWE7_STRCE
MTNPFDNEAGRFRVLRNAEGRHSLWPADMGLPPGWTVVHDEDSRQGCLEYVERNWTELRPVGAGPTGTGGPA